MFLIDIIIFILVLSAVILVHELGHFFAAKSTGTKVEEFGIGFPPKIWKKKIGETEYSIGAFPFGGFNKIYGMDDGEEDINDPKSYDSKSTWVKLWICGAGVVMNIIFAAIIFYFLLIVSNFQSSQALLYSGYHFPFGSQINYPIVAQVVKDSPADNVGLKQYDVIESVNGVKVSTVEQFSNIINENKGIEVDIKIKDRGDIKITPRVNPPKGEGSLGIALREMANITYSSLGDKIFLGFVHSYNMIDYSFSVMGSMISNSIKEKSIETLAYSTAGPVGIFAITKLAIARGMYDLMNLVAILSIAVGISNLLPIPAMDGAKLIYTSLQVVNKKIFSKKLLVTIESYGMLLLILLAILIVFKDFIQFKDIIFK